MDVLGHLHTHKSDRRYVLNGSAIGYNPFSIKIRSDYEPPIQAFFALHHKKFKIMDAPIYCD